MFATLTIRTRLTALLAFVNLTLFAAAQMLERHPKGLAESSRKVVSLLAQLNEAGPKIGLPGEAA